MKFPGNFKKILIEFWENFVKHRKMPIFKKYKGELKEVLKK